MGTAKTSLDGADSRLRGYAVFSIPTDKRTSKRFHGLGRPTQGWSRD